LLSFADHKNSSHTHMLVTQPYQQQCWQCFSLLCTVLQSHFSSGAKPQLSVFHAWKLHTTAQCCEKHEKNHIKIFSNWNRLQTLSVKNAKV